MKRIILAALAALTLTAPAYALDPSTYQGQTLPARPHIQQPDESALLEHRHYRNSDGNSIHSRLTPAATKPQ